VHVAQAVLLAYTTIKRLVLGMRMDVDEARQYQPILAVDNLVCHAAVIPSDEHDRAPGKGNVQMAPVDMTAGGLIPGHDPIGIADNGGGQPSSPFS